MQIVGGRNRRVVFTHSAGDATDVSSYTFNSVAFGTVSPRRHIIVAFAAGQLGANLTAPNSMTIGGVTATQIGGDTGASTSWIQLWAALVPTGTSGSIVVTRAGNMSFGVIVAWAAYDLSSITPFDVTVGFGTPTATLDVDTPGGGVVVAFARESGTGTPTFTWSGLTEDVDTTFAGDTVSYTGASASKVPTAAPRAVSVTASTSNQVNGIAASFR